MPYKLIFAIIFLSFTTLACMKGDEWYTYIKSIREQLCSLGPLLSDEDELKESVAKLTADLNKTILFSDIQQIIKKILFEFIVPLEKKRDYLAARYLVKKETDNYVELASLIKKLLDALDALLQKAVNKTNRDFLRSFYTRLNYSLYNHDLFTQAMIDGIDTEETKRYRKDLKNLLEKEDATYKFCWII